MQVTPISCLADNYAYIISDESFKTVGVIDPSEAEPIISYLDKKKIKLSYILNTHHHFDHIGGNDKLKKKYNAKVIGFEGDKHRIPGIDITVKNNDQWIFGNSSVKILHIPGHTLGHICFFFQKEKVTESIKTGHFALKNLIPNYQENWIKGLPHLSISYRLPPFEKASNILFGKSTANDLQSLDETTFLSVFEGVPTAKIKIKFNYIACKLNIISIIYFPPVALLFLH